MRFDIHVHSEFSPCSNASLIDIINTAPLLGLDGICITDHDSIKAENHISEGIQSNGLVVIIGMEYTTDGGDFLIFGPVKIIPAGLSAPELLNFVSEAEGIAIAAHPARKERPVDESLYTNELCSYIEVLNGRNSDEENIASQSLIHSYSLKGAGGSDAHSIEELGKIITEFDADITCSEDLIKAFKSGNFSAQYNTEKSLIPS